MDHYLTDAASTIAGRNTRPFDHEAPALDEIGHRIVQITETVLKSRALVRDFLSRCGTGGMIQTGEKASGEAPRPVGHIHDINSWLNDLEAIANALSENVNELRLIG